MDAEIDKSASEVVRYRAYRVRGSLYCSDPKGLWQTLRRGVGRGKAFGLGLLSLAPAR